MLRRFLLPCSFCVQRKISYFGLNILGIGIMIRILVKKQHMFLLPNELAAAALLCRDLGTLVEFSGAGTALPAVESKARPLSVTALETSSAGGRGEGGQPVRPRCWSEACSRNFSCISRTLGVSVKNP